MNHWEMIQANAHKVPGLEVRIRADGWCEILRDGLIDEWIKTTEDTPREHRTCAMVVVDAIEAAGLAEFERTYVPGDYWWQGSFMDYDEEEMTHVGVYIKAHSEQEHLALLECVAKTLEALK